MKKVSQMVEVKYNYTGAELQEMGLLLAQLSQQANEKEAERKSAMAGYKHDLEEIQKQFGEIVNKLNSRFEMRNVFCMVIKNYATSVWEFYEKDSYTLIKTAPFKGKDFQRDLLDTQPDTPVTPELETPVPEPVDLGTPETNPPYMLICSVRSTIGVRF